MEFDPLCNMDIPRILLNNGANPNVGWSFLGPILHLLFRLCDDRTRDSLVFDPLFLFSLVLKSGATDEMNEDAII